MVIKENNKLMMILHCTKEKPCAESKKKGNINNLITILWLCVVLDRKNYKYTHQYKFVKRIFVLI